jgi:homoserine O-acetyltransferase
VPLTVAGVDSDRLYPLYLQRQLAEWSGAAGPAQIRSPHGHDGFLLENDQIGAVVAGALADWPDGYAGAAGLVTDQQTSDQAGGAASPR